MNEEVHPWETRFFSNGFLHSKASILGSMIVPGDPLRRPHAEAPQLRQCHGMRCAEPQSWTTTNRPSFGGTWSGSFHQSRQPNKKSLAKWIPGWWFGCHQFYFPMNWVANHPNWRTHIFQRGGPTTNQIKLLCFLRAGLNWVLPPPQFNAFFVSKTCEFGPWGSPFLSRPHISGPKSTGGCPLAMPKTCIYLGSRIYHWLVRCDQKNGIILEIWRFWKLICEGLLKIVWISSYERGKLITLLNLTDFWNWLFPLDWGFMWATQFLVEIPPNFLGFSGMVSCFIALNYLSHHVDDSWCRLLTRTEIGRRTQNERPVVSL